MLNHSYPGADSTPRSAPRLPRRAIRHDGPCGKRTLCFRPACRAEFGLYRTAEVLVDGTYLAYCHGARYGAGDLIVRATA